MDLQPIITEIKDLFNETDLIIEHFKNHTQLQCESYCSKCCNNPSIEATILEFLPLSDYLYKNNTIEDFYDSLLKTNEIGCPLYNNSSDNKTWGCRQYAYRGLICRLFGFSARLNKYHCLELITCKIIKQKQSESYQMAVKTISENNFVPIFSDFYTKLSAIDFFLSADKYPIRIAIRKAIEYYMLSIKYTENS